MAGVLTLETEVLQLAHQEQVQTPTMTNSNGNDIADLAIQEQCQRPAGFDSMDDSANESLRLLAESRG